MPGGKVPACWGFSVLRVSFLLRLSFLVRLALGGALILGGFSAGTTLESQPKRVLLLYSYDREEGIFGEFDRAFRSELTGQLHSRIEFFTEYLDIIRFNSLEHDRELATLLSAKYSTLKPDLVVPVSFAALNFVLGEGTTRGPFANVPVVTLFNTRSAEAIKLASANRNQGAGVTGVATTDEPLRTLNLALKLQPDTQRVVVITGSSAREHQWLQELQGDFVSDEHHLEFLYFNDMTMDMLLAKVRTLPAHTVILYTYFFEDGGGQFFLPEEALDMIARVSPVPIYGIEDTYIGHKVVGGYMTNAASLGSLAAGSCARVLNGEKASSVPIVADTSSREMVDWRELQRWNISATKVPPGAVQFFREPSPWERYRTLILACLGLAIVETALVMALIVNVTRLKRTERALIREKTLANAVIEGLPGLFIMQNEEGRNVRWNKNAAEFARFGPEGISRLDNVADYDREAAERARRETFVKGHGEIEVDMLNASGGVTPFFWNALRVELENKPYITAIGTDLSASKQAEIELRRSEAQLRSFVEKAPYGIARVSVNEDRFLTANPALVKMLGYESEGELLALNLSRDLYLEGDSSGFRAQPTRADFFRDIDFTWKRGDGKPISVRASGRRVVGDKGDALEIIVEDVTTRRALEEQLRQAQKMEALGQLAGSTAHDFNNLLAVIIGHCELLAATLEDNGPAGSRVEIIKKAGERAASLTSQLLAFSRRQVMQLRTLNLNLLVTETSRMLEHVLGADIEHRLDLDPSIDMVKADSGQLVQVIMNLAVNARDAMPNGGALMISTASVTLQDETLIQKSSVPAGTYIVLAVRDSGMGMDAETQAHLFEPFFTTKPVGKGTGLGLATVFGIIKQSGGFIFVESEVGKGTTFRIYFPRVRTEIEIAEMNPVPVLPAKAATILLVEDEPAFRNLLAEGLQAAGYRVLVGENGVEALNIASQFADAIDLLLTDVIMPQMNGTDLARCVRGIHPETKVLYMSGYTDDKLQLISTDSQVALLQKPFYVRELLRKIQELLHLPVAPLGRQGATGG